MTAKKKITDKNGVQVYPITHTKAVLDDNGNSVEQRLQENLDLINQKQLEVGAVPSDVIPTEGSTNWVTSGGVKQALDKIENGIMIDGEALALGSSARYIISSDGIWTGKNSTHYLIKVNAGDKIKAYTRLSDGTHVRATFRWLTSDTTPVLNAQAPLSTVDSSVYNIDDEYGIITAPSDAEYLYVLGVHTDINHTPSAIIRMDSVTELTRNNKANISNISELISDDLSGNIKWITGIVNSDGSITNNDKRAYSEIITVKYGFEVKALEGYAIRGICYYDNDGFLSRTWFAEPKTSYKEDNSCVVRVLVSKVNDTEAIGVVAGHIIFMSSEYCGTSVIEQQSERKLSYHSCQPVSWAGSVVTLGGLIISNTDKTRRMWWYPMKKGDTVKIIIEHKDNVENNYSLVYFNSDIPSTSLIDSQRLWYQYSNADKENVEYTYTAEENGFVAFTYNDNVFENASILVHYGNDDGVSNNFIPKISCGTQIISRPEDTYCHAPMIRMNDDYMFICYHGGNSKTTEVVNNTSYVMLLVINKKNGRSKYVPVYSFTKPDYIDGNVCSEYYNHSTILIGGTNTIMVRCGCQCDGKWMLIYKTYNADTDTLSDVNVQQLSYNGNTYDFNLANYITMVNTLYNKSFSVVQLRATNEITDMCYYNNKYYCVMAYACHDKTSIPARFIQCPHVFAVSDDAITWTPIANVTDDYYSAETLLAIVNDIVYHVFRSDRLGEFYMVFDIQGNVLKSPEPTNNPLSKVWSKPAIVYSGGRVLIGFNKVYNDGVSSDIYSLRTKMCLAEIAQSAPYGLTEYKTYVSANGWNYYHFAGKKNGNIIGVNVEDSRNLNDNIHQVVTDVNIYEIDVLELTES